MKNRIGKGLLFIIMTLMIVSCQTRDDKKGTAVIDTEQVKKEIQAKENEFAELYNTGEMKTIGYYADDAITFTQNSGPIVGKPAIIEYLKAHIDSLSKNNKISFQTNEVFVSNDANQVVEIGYYRVVDSAGTLINSGNYMSLFVKRDGRYVSLRDMSASDIPLE
jgi:ketosteroid isomerase-like protein